MSIEIHRATIERVISEAPLGRSTELRDAVLSVAGDLLTGRGLTKLEPLLLLHLDDALSDDDATPTVRAFASVVYLLHEERYNAPRDVTMMEHWASLLKINIQPEHVGQTVML